MKRLCMALIRFYRRALSGLKPYPTCRFTPTCSAYALEAFDKRGFFAGFALTLWRILRCSPLSPGGYDPVPMTGFRTIPLRWSKYRKQTAAKTDETAFANASPDPSDDAETETRPPSSPEEDAR